MEDSEQTRAALLRKDSVAYRIRYADRYLGPNRVVMKFRHFNPLTHPGIAASQYEDAFPDVGREEMERRFSLRRSLFLKIYDPQRPGVSLAAYMRAAQDNEGYRYKPEASSGPVSMFLGGSIPRRRVQKGELPECHLLGFVDGNGRVGCMAHPMAETSHGYDGRDLAGFFHHTGGCRNIGCEASRQFKLLSPSALKVFDKAVEGMSWYEYSRHATSVLVHYLRSYDHLLQQLEHRSFLDSLTLEEIVGFTNSLYDDWPLKRRLHQARHRRLSHDSSPMSAQDILSAGIPPAEHWMYAALDTWFLSDHFEAQLRRAREHIERRVEAFCRKRQTLKE